MQLPSARCSSRGGWPLRPAAAAAQSKASPRNVPATQSPPTPPPALRRHPTATTKQNKNNNKNKSTAAARPPPAPPAPSLMISCLRPHPPSRFHPPRAPVLCRDSELAVPTGLRLEVSGHSGDVARTAGRARQAASAPLACVGARSPLRMRSVTGPTLYVSIAIESSSAHTARILLQRHPAPFEFEFVDRCPAQRSACARACRSQLQLHCMQLQASASQRNSAALTAAVASSAGWRAATAVKTAT